MTTNDIFTQLQRSLHDFTMRCIRQNVFNPKMGTVLEFNPNVELKVRLNAVEGDIILEWSEGHIILLSNESFVVDDIVVMFPFDNRYVIIGKFKQNPISEIANPPIGSIMAWAKSLTGVPTLPFGWVECDGSVLSDAGSLLNGSTLPDLNGTPNAFLRGNATSGGTGGNLVHTHTNHSAHATHTIHPVHDIHNRHQTFDNDDGTGANRESVNFNSSQHDPHTAHDPHSAHSAHENHNSPNHEPPFYNVVYIIRIK